MILSIHIPKTGGTRFREVLRQRYGQRLALYYGAASERTHPLARRRPKEFDAAMFRDLEAAGIAVLHGHFRAPDVAPHVPDPKRYWVWLREPVEQTVSHYHFVQTVAQPNVHRDRIARAGLSLPEFAATPEMRAFQSRWVEPFGLADLGFVGVSELFPLMLPLLDLADTAAGGNANPGKPLVDRATRQTLATTLAADVALYSEAMELAMRRLGGRERRASPIRRLAAAVRGLARG